MAKEKQVVELKGKDKKPGRLIIRKFESSGGKPLKTVTIPLGVVKFARSLIPKRAKEAMSKEGIDIDNIVDMAQNVESSTILVEVEDHAKNTKTVVSIE